jgi:N-acetylmuramoyl-L-alanine amidase
MKLRWIISAAAVLFLLAAAGPVEDKDLLTLAHDMGAVLEWDPLRDAGVLVVGDDRISLGVGSDSALINYRLRVTIDPPVRRNGAVVLTTAAVAAIGDAVQQDRLAHAGERMRVSYVILDPGHGGKDPGSNGTYKDGSKTVTLLEKDITLSIALKLGEMLQAAYPDRKIVYTRTTDSTVSLESRPELANDILKKTSDTVLYIAIHANSSPLRATKTSGFEVWYLPPAYRRSVLDKSSVQPEDYDILNIMNMMREEEITLETTLLAQQISAGLARSIGDRTLNRGLLSNDWAVVRDSRMPAVLLEVGFVNNPEEAKRLADPAYLKDIAQGIYTGITGFIARFERNQE